MMRQRVEMDAGPESAREDAIIGRSSAMQTVYKAIGRVAGTDATVLIRGESGTGKELVARAIYQHSNRADNQFLVINCVAIPETLLESELFGPADAGKPYVARQCAGTGKCRQESPDFQPGYPIQPRDVHQAIAENKGEDETQSIETLESIGRQWIREMLAEGGSPDMFNHLMDRFGSMVVSEALNMTGGNRSRAAKILGMSRPTLQARIEKYNLSLETSVKDS